MAGLPHGVWGWPPMGALPSPPPWGWSRGFIAEPRTVGRRPMPRATGLAEGDVLVVDVAELADRGHAARRAPGAARRRAAGPGPSRPPWPSAAPPSRRRAPSARRARVELDVVDDRARPACCAAARALPGRPRPPARRITRVAHPQPDRAPGCSASRRPRTEQRDARRAVRIVLDGDDPPGTPILSRFQSMMRYRRLWPPPRWRMVMLPWLLRPAVLLERLGQRASPARPGDLVERGDTTSRAGPARWACRSYWHTVSWSLALVSD